MASRHACCMWIFQLRDTLYFSAHEVGLLYFTTLNPLKSLNIFKSQTK